MSLLSTYERIIQEAGGPENLADMIICESPEFFGFGEFNAAKRRLIKKKKYKVSMLLNGVKIERLVREKRYYSIKRATRLNSKYWTEDQIDYLRRNISVLEYDQMSKHLNRSIMSLYAKVHDLQIGKRHNKRRLA